MQSAPNPSNIHWENLASNRHQIFKRLLLANTASVILLIIIIVGFSSAKNQMNFTWKVDENDCEHVDALFENNKEEYQKQAFEADMLNSEGINHEIIIYQCYCRLYNDKTGICYYYNYINLLIMIAN